eukprot:10957583-Alexandrium_andersonii.AAC.1
MAAVLEEIRGLMRGEGLVMEVSWGGAFGAEGQGHHVEVSDVAYVDDGVFVAEDPDCGRCIEKLLRLVQIVAT